MAETAQRDNPPVMRAVALPCIETHAVAELMPYRDGVCAGNDLLTSTRDGAGWDPAVESASGP